MSPQSIRILEPQVVLTDILRRKTPVRKRKRNNIRLLPPTTRRTRSSGLVAEDKDDIPKPLIPVKRANTASVAGRKKRGKPGRPLRIKKDNVVHAILRKRDDIVQADGQLVPCSDPAWVFIKQELDNKIAVTTLHRIAERDMYKLLFGDQEPSDDPGAATADAANVTELAARNRDDAAPEESTSARDNKAALEESTLARNATALGAFTRIHDNTMVLREPNRDPPAPGVQPNREHDNATVYEQLLLNLVNTIDCLNKEIKELTNELRQRNNLKKRNLAC